MKPTIVAAVVAMTFVGGVAIGVLFMSGNSTAPEPAGPGASSGGGASGGKGRKVDLGSGGGATTGGGSGSSAGGGTRGPSGPGGIGPGAGPAGRRPNGPPPPLSPEAMAEGEKIKAALARRRENKGEAEAFTTLDYHFDTPEERESWEANRRDAWLTRLNREIEIKLKNLVAKVGLTPEQTRQVKAVLDSELAARMNLVDRLAAKTLALDSFRGEVRKNKADAKEKLAEILSQKQLATYEALDPREQVLRDDLK